MSGFTALLGMKSFKKNIYSCVACLGQVKPQHINFNLNAHMAVNFIGVTIQLNQLKPYTQRHRDIGEVTAYIPMILNQIALDGR